MEFYQEHPARKRAMDAPKAGNVPRGINEWMSWIDEREEKAGYPIDHSDGERTTNRPSTPSGRRR